MSKIKILINCPDKKGIIAAITNFILKNDANITYIDQHVDKEYSIFFMRLECVFSEDNFDFESFKFSFNNEIAQPFEMSWQAYSDNEKPKMALFVSKYDHCIYDILVRHHSGELNVDIPLIISNHIDLKHIGDNFNIPYFHIPVTKENKKEAEQKQLSLVKEHQIDFIVLARYMQIIPKEIIEHYPNNIINIHHSFLPAFPGAKPYHSAFKRGVKIIGATSHYVTEELDEGPIIEQDITRVSHIHSIDDFITKGRDLEKIVLSRAIKLHSERKTMVFSNKTIIFS
jgi:formyltetrahydrofolate deformylase